MRIYKFGDLVGNGLVVSRMRRGIIEGVLENFIIINGVMGTGKSSSADIIALALTCDNMEDGEPCLQCSYCKATLEAFKGTGRSSRVYKKNMPEIKDKKEMEELLQEIFLMSGSMGNKVYIFGEVQDLHTSLQSLFMEQIDKLRERKDITIIMTTTRMHKLLPEIRNRTIPFNFSRLTAGESRILLDKILVKNGIPRNDRTELLILKYSEGIPRSIVLSVEFVRDYNPTEEDLAKHLGMIPQDELCQLLLDMKHGVKDTYIGINSLLSQYPVDSIAYYLKELIVDLSFSIGIGEPVGISSENFKKLSSSLSGSILDQFLVMVERLTPATCSEPDLRLLIIKMVSAIQGTSRGHVFSSNESKAKAQSITAKAKYEEEELYRKDSSNKVNIATAETMDKFRRK